MATSPLYNNLSGVTLSTAKVTSGRSDLHGLPTWSRLLLFSFDVCQQRYNKRSKTNYICKREVHTPHLLSGGRRTHSRRAVHAYYIRPFLFMVTVFIYMSTFHLQYSRRLQGEFYYKSSYCSFLFLSSYRNLFRPAKVSGILDISHYDKCIVWNRKRGVFGNEILGCNWIVILHVREAHGCLD
ncbi:hypothetical protein D3C73_301310 [compost metagenome]